MIIKVLGSAAGGGFPQWNCNGRNSRAVRDGAPGYRSRTQSSLAVSSDGASWVLLNASPDLREQIVDNAELWPSKQGPLRNSPIKAVVLTNGDVDHIAGLINLREAQPFTIYAAERVLATLAANSIFNVLSDSCVIRRGIELEHAFELTDHGATLGLVIEAFAVPGKVALYLEQSSGQLDLASKSGDTIGLKVTDRASGTSFFYIPGCATIDADLAQRIRGADLVFFDGTLFTDSEMVDQGLMPKTGKRMGHMSMSGDDGSIAAFAKLDVARRIYVHINNSNPVLDENSDARKAVEAAGWEVGYDGMEVRL